MYIHSPLNRENFELRLIRFNVLEHKPPESLTLELRHVSLREEVPYGAISYVWGDQNERVEVEINGEPFPIGHNLFAVLRQLQLNGVKTWLWVDSISIQQSNLEEKAWHVDQMRDVFSCATTTYCWLGPGTHPSDVAMDFVCRIGPRALAAGALDLRPHHPRYHLEIQDYLVRRRCSEQAEEADNQRVVSELPRFIFDVMHEDDLNIPSPSNNLYKGINDLLQRDYWHRIWIVQEIALAKEAFIMCGERIVQLEVFDATFTSIWYCLQSGIKLIDQEYDRFGFGLSRTLYRINALETRRKHCLQNQTRLVDILFQTGVAPGRPHYSASDPRDIVFGVLGIISDKDILGVQTDYMKTDVEVFARATKALLKNNSDQRRSEPFCLDACVPGEETGPLPTWVPDWQQIGKYGLGTYPINHYRVFDATPDTDALDTGTDSVSDNNILILPYTGCRVDVISEVMPPPEWHKHDEWSVSFIKDADSWLSSVFDFANLGPDPSPAEDHVWRTVLLDWRRALSPSFRRPPYLLQEDVKHLIRLILRRQHIDAGTMTENQAEFVRNGPIRHFPREDPQFADLNDYVTWFTDAWKENIGTVTRNRTLFKTANGMFGLGHVTIKPGDIVTLLWGVKSPIILRPKNGHVDGGGFYFQGDAYVDGIMYGEFLRYKPTVHEEIFRIF